MTPLSAFRPLVAPRVAPWAADPQIDRAVLDACIEFCERSLVVRKMLDSFQTSVGKFEYDLYGPNQQSVCMVARLWSDSCDLTPLDDDQAPAPFDRRQAAPRAFSLPEPDALHLHPTPDGIFTINVRAALRPKRNAKQVEDRLFEDWSDAIMDGALSRLYAMPGEGFSAVLSGEHSKRFTAAVNTAMLEASAGRTRTELRVTPVRI